MSDSQREIELKFVLTAEAARRIRAQAFAQGRDDELASTYFDTPALDLRAATATLRLRRTGDGWVQTLKAAGASAISRFEDERPAPEGRLDASLFPRKVLRRLGDVDPADLKPLFETRVKRRIQMALRNGAAVETALDEGDIRLCGANAGDGRTPIRELELELKSGSMADLFALAREFAVMDGVRLSLVAKSERGYQLASGEGPSAVKFRPPVLAFDGSAAEGFQSLALAALTQLSHNVEVLNLIARPEAVHQARVALRQLKSFVGAFKPLVADAQAEAIHATLKRLTAVFEDARTLDVFQADAFQPLAGHEPGAASFGAALVTAHAHAYAAVEAAVRSPAFAQDLFDLAAWTLCGPWTLTDAASPDDGQTLKAMAHKLLSHRWKVFRHRGEALDWSDAAARHRLRIQAKKMRYLAEAFAVDASARPFLKRLAALQDELGVLNDIATAPASARLALDGASPETAFAAGAVVGELRAGADKRLKAARRALAHMAGHKPFWRE